MYKCNNKTNIENLNIENLGSRCGQATASTSCAFFSYIPIMSLDRTTAVPNILVEKILTQSNVSTHDMVDIIKPHVTLGRSS